jgi:hypothetical protein
MLEDPVSRLKAALAVGRCVPFIGAGASISVGGPGWGEYVSQLIQGLPNADELSHRSRQPNVSVIDIASLAALERSRLRLASPEVRLRAASPVHKSLVAWKAPLYLTTNYDDGMERGFVALEESCDVLLNDQLSQLSLWNKIGNPVLLKLCSSTRDRSYSGAVTNSEFAHLIYGSPIIELLTTILRTHLVFFVGCGMGDPLVKEALNKCSESALAYVEPIALLPKNVPPELELSLRNWKVQTLNYVGPNHTVAIYRELDAIQPHPRGSRHLLIFEPGLLSKLDRILRAVDALSAVLKLASITVVTSFEEIGEEFLKWARGRSTSLTTVVHLINCYSAGCVESIVRELGKGAPKWDGFFVADEFAVEPASAVVELYEASGYGRSLQFHDCKTAKLSRDKRRFREFLDTFCSKEPLARNAVYRTFPLWPDITGDTLLRTIKSGGPWPSGKLVIKPPDAASSIGVRPISLDAEDEVESIRALDNFVQVVANFPKQIETSGCDSSEVLVEERLEGDEFSVECRRVAPNVDPEVVAIHWKPGIDNDRLKFFERIYVTLPPELGPYKKLESVNIALLKELGVETGVFHSESRVVEGIVRPLEIGLRPGGGMVSAQVHASHGVDLFEAGLLCAFQLAQSVPRFSKVVASAEIFATQPGVLPSLTVRNGDTQPWTVGNADGERVKDWLESRLRACPRPDARALLSKLLKDDTPMARDVLSSFNDNGVGLRANVDYFKLWLRPGEIVTEEESAYVAGLRVVCDPALTLGAAVAEAVAAMEVCYHSIECIPQPRLPAIDC